MAFDFDAQLATWKRNLLDTTKRNRLIKFSTGRAGGVKFVFPDAHAFWGALVCEERPFSFPWKRDLLGLPAEAIDNEDTTADTGGPGESPPSPTSVETVDHAEPATGGGPVANDKTVTPSIGGTLAAGNPESGVRAGSATPPSKRSSKTPTAPRGKSLAEGSGSLERKPRTIEELTQECIDSGTLRSDHLLTDLTDKKLAANLVRLSRTSLEAETDHGVSTLYAAFGFLRWYESNDSAVELRSPLVLVPVRLERETVESAWKLKVAEGDPAANHCLGELLKNDFNVVLPTAKDGEIDADDPEGLAAYLSRVEQRVRPMPRWEVVPEIGLGVFNFQKLAMWEDLEKNAQRIKAHALCLALAGDQSVELRPPSDMVAAGELDERVPPESVNHILDADSSQHEAIEAIKRGANVVIDGPPGTGKSQTIANAIAELLASGKTVLFVSEKTAALEVVKRRLDDRGLGDFCLELHSHKANKREVAAELGRSLELAPEPYHDTAAELRQLAERRRTLNRYAAELHRVRTPLGLSAFQVLGELAKLERLPRRSQWSASDPFTRDGDYLRRASETLARLVHCRGVVDNPQAHPWRGCRMTQWTATGADDLRHHLLRLREATSLLLGGANLESLALEGPSETLSQWGTALQHARDLVQVPVVPEGWFRKDAAATAAATRDLHATTERIREVARTLPMYSTAAIRSVTVAEAAAVAKALNPARELLACPPVPSGLRAQRLGELAEAIRTFFPCAAELKVAVASLLKALRLPERQPAVDNARKYAVIATEVAQGPPVRSSWWDPAKRAELRNVMAQSGEAEQSARTTRARLAGTIMPTAFAPESADAVRDALHRGGSFFRRLFPGWRRAQQRVSAWYATTPPDRAGLMADLRALSDFHRQSAYVRDVERDYAADFLPSASGAPDWPATMAGLAAIEKYEKRNLPKELKSALTPDGGLDREALVEAAQAVSLADSKFRNAWAGLSEIYALAAAPDSLARSAVEVEELMRADIEAASAEANALAQLTRMLVDPADLGPGTWKAHSTAIARLTSLRADAAAHARLLALDPDDPAFEEVDRSQDALVAGKLLAFLNRLGRPPSTPTVKALTDVETRAKLEAAVEVSDRILREGFEESWNYLTRSVFDPSVPVSDGIVLGSASIRQLHPWVAARCGDSDRLEEWILFAQVRREANEFGVGPIVDEVLSGRLGVEEAAPAFRQRFLKFWLDALNQNVPALRDFNTESHEAVVRRFGQLDRLVLAATPGRLRSQLLSHADRPRADGTTPSSSELGIILGQANRKRAHLPVRKLFSKVPTVLPRLKPCMMMSPLAVSTYLNNPDAVFDVVIFDEASQVRPYDAVCAVYRGRQLVVAGDPKQLPPTSFFDRASDDDFNPDDDGDAMTGFESLLDVCLSLGMVRKRLRWHYRSRQEALIAFSNKFFYDGSLVTFPSAHDGSNRAVRFERVADGVFADTVNVPEAKRTAELVIRHFQDHPGQSLGVIAFSQSQQNRILDELEALRRTHPDLEGFFKEDRSDRFFVKNLENVQGDERDAIFLSVGYGPDATGKVPMRFGPLNRQGGERRLNVAITRARHAMTVISSLTAADIDLSRTQAVGAKLLKSFLDFAERGPAALTEAVTEADEGGFDSPFEREVFEELQRRGLTLHKQVGCGGFKIDMAVVDPDAGGRYLLGVECDGATYHSSATARDRDRLRQVVLEGLGWRLCRIWSTDWLRNREKQVVRVLTAVQSRREVVDPTPPVDPALPMIAPTLAPPAPPETPALAYERIEDVPEGVIRTEAMAVTAKCGSMDAEELYTYLSRQLGFKRLGAKIREQIDRVVQLMIQVGELEQLEGNRLRLSAHRKGLLEPKSAGSRP